MTSENAFFYIVIYILFEYYEISWQKSDTIMGMLLRMYPYYDKSVFLFLLMHPTYYFILYLLLLTNEFSTLLLMLFVKTVDIVTKIVLIEQVFIKRSLSQELTMMLLTPIHPLMPYIGLALYPPLLAWALFTLPF